MEAAKNQKNEFFKELPHDILLALHKFLTSKDYQALKSQLARTGIIIEKDEYQISIPTIQKLDEIIGMLNEKYETQ